MIIYLDVDAGLWDRKFSKYLLSMEITSVQMLLAVSTSQSSMYDLEKLVSLAFQRSWPSQVESTCRQRITMTPVNYI
jgi:hypothetical protein